MNAITRDRNFREYVSTFVQRVPRYAIKTRNGWHTEERSLRDETVKDHLDKRCTVGTLGKWYPEFSVLDMDSVSLETVENVREKLNLDESNSMLLSSESAHSYHLLLRPAFNDKPPTIRLLQKIFQPFCRINGVEIYPQKQRVIRLPFGALHNCLDFEYFILDDWQKKLYWFQKLDSFDLSTVRFQQQELGLILPKQKLPRISVFEEGRMLLQYGLQGPSSRHESQFKVIYYLWRLDVPQNEAEKAAWQWINTMHNGF